MIRIKQKTSQVLPILAAVFLALSFVFMGVWVRMMASSFGTWQQVYLRMLLAGLMAAMVFRRSFSWKFLRQIQARDWAVYILRGLFANTIGVGFFTIAVQHAQLSTVSFVSSLPILGILGWLMFRQKVQLATVPFIGLSVVGLVLLTGVDLRDFHLGWGETAAIIAMLGFDLGYMMSRYHPKRFSNYQNTTLLLLTAWVPLFVVSRWRGEPLVPHHISMMGWTGLVVSSVLNVLALYLINYVFGHLKAYVAGNIFLLEGVFALAVGFVLYHEVPTVLALVGAGIILACAYGISLIDARSGGLEAAQSEIE